MKKKISSLRKSLHIIVLLLFTINLLLVTSKVQAEESSSTNIIRYEGHSRENVAEAVAKAHFRNSNKVILVNRDKFPDAISATNISQGEHPVLYTHSNRVSDSTIELLKAMSLDEIYILGGELSINKEVVDQLQQTTNVKVTRIAGRSRYDANESAVRENFTQKHHVVIASGEVYSDALYGVSYANTIDAPIILTKTNQLESSTIELLKDLGVQRATIIGGTLTVTEAVENQLNQLNIHYERIAGRNRYIGSSEVANASYDNPENIVIASGEVFSDALVSAPLAQKLKAPILLVRENRIEDSVKNYLINFMDSVNSIFIQGGLKTISDNLESKISRKFEPVITTETRKENHKIQHEVKRIGVPYIPHDEEWVEVEGINGEREKVFEQRFEDGILVSERLVLDTITKEPVTKVVYYGDITVEPELDQELFAQEMLKLVNELRVSVGVHELVYSSELQPGTDIRVNELKNLYSHTRPNGTNFSTAFEDIEWLSLGENITMYYLRDFNYKDGKSIEAYLAQEMFNMFYNSKGHYENMIGDYYYTFATGVTKANRFYANVQIFGRTEEYVVPKILN